MSWIGRIVIIAVVFGTGAPLTGCAPRGSSFETLGVPAPEGRSGRTPVILGWAREDRSGWIIDRVRIDDRTRNEWNEGTQEPIVLYLSPGEHEVRLNAAQLSNPRDTESRPRRRYRIRPIQLDLLEGEAQLCVLRLAGEERRRPRAQCEIYEHEVEEEEDEYAEDDRYEDEYEEYDDEDEFEGEYTEGQDEEQDEEPQRPPQDFGATGMPGADEAAPTAMAEPAEPAEPEPAAASGVPSPFGPGAASTPPPAAPAEPVAERAEPTPASASGGTAPRRLTVEQRLERLERMVEEIRRELRSR